MVDLVHPSKHVQQTELSKQDQQKSNYDSTITRNLELTPKSSVMVRNYSTVAKNCWVPTRVLKQTGPVSYKCELPEGHVVRHHQDQILIRSTPSIPSTRIKTLSPVISDESALSPIVPDRVDKPNGGAEVDVLPKLTTP
ncbi:hypothetical protein SK128_019135, partial [Halocaridina rubra]